MKFIRNGVEFTQCKFYPALRFGKSTIVKKEFDGYSFSVTVGKDKFEFIAHHPITLKYDGTCKTLNHKWCISDAESGLRLSSYEYDCLEDIARDTNFRIIGFCARIQNDEIFRSDVNNAKKAALNGERVQDAETS